MNKLRLWHLPAALLACVSLYIALMGTAVVVGFVYGAVTEYKPPRPVHVYKYKATPAASAPPVPKNSRQAP